MLIAKEVETYKEESLINKVTIQLVKEGFKEERLNLVKPPLLKDSKENETIEEKVLRVKQEVPELFQGTKDANPTMVVVAILKRQAWKNTLKNEEKKCLN